MGTGTKRTLKALGITGTAVAAAYALAVRPWQNRWGATDEETAAPLPGDDFVEDAAIRSTRAITIAAPAAAVWARIVQLGQNQQETGGAARLDEWLGFSVRSRNPHQPTGRLALGDEVRLEPAVLRLPRFTVAVIDPGRTLVLSTPGWETGSSTATWTFALHRVGPGATRMVVRFQSQAWTRSERLLNHVVIEPLQFARERALLKTVRERAEQPHSVPRGGRRT